MVSEQEIRERIEYLRRRNGESLLLDEEWLSLEEKIQAIKDAATVTGMVKILFWVLEESGFEKDTVAVTAYNKIEQLRSVIQEFLVFENEMPIGDRTNEEMMNMTEKMAEVIE